jgi:hypothetical protein
MASEIGWVRGIDQYKLTDLAERAADVKRRNEMIMMGIPTNIIVFMTDQQRWDSLGYYRFQGMDTPNLDRLAREGVLFNI